MDGDTGGSEELRTRLDALSDEGALRRLLIEYFRGFEEGRSDDDWLRSVFTEDAVVDFPAGKHRGIAGLGEVTRRIAGLWDRILHLLSNYRIDLEGDRARMTAVLHATHIHHDSARAPLRIGANVRAEAFRGPGG